MHLVRPLRLPLSTGASPVNLALGLGVFGFLAAAPVFIGSLLPDIVALVCGVLLAIWFFVLVMFPIVAKRQRASDVVLDAQGITIVGGPYRGRRLGWDEFLRQPPSFRRTREPTERLLMLPGGIEIVASEAEEIASLKSLARTLTTLALGFEAAEAPEVRHGGATAVPRCANCGAPVAPSDASTVPCLHCDGEAAIPEALRREVGHLRRLIGARAASTAALAVLSRWPRALTINVVLAIAAIPLVFAWPLSAVLASEFLQYHDVFSWRDVGVLFVSTGALTVGLFFWLSAQTVHRQAFRLVVATFHAVRSGEHGLACRCCGAPLDVRPDTPLVACAFCRSDNVVLGLDLPPRVAAESEQAASLDTILRERLRSMKVWRRLTLVSVALIALGGLLLVAPLRRAATSAAPRHAPIDRAWSYPGPAE